MAGNFPRKLRYTSDHEWLEVHADGTATMGITDYAQEALGDIVFVEMPQIGDTLDKGAVLGVVESVKTTSDVYMPVGGTITAVNEDLARSPERVNEGPYEGGWLVKMTLTDPAEAADLMDADAYAQHVAAIDH